MTSEWLPPEGMYPTVCGFCGRKLTEGEDGLMHCIYPRWMEGPEVGLDRDPEAYAGWTPIGKRRGEDADT